MAPSVRYHNEACNDVDNRAQEKEKTRHALRPTAERKKTLSICTKLRAVPIRFVFISFHFGHFEKKALR